MSLDLSGTYRYEISDGFVRVWVDRISNNSSTVTTGTIRIELWASETPYSGHGAQFGYRLLALRPNHDRLQPNQYLYDIEVSGPQETDLPNGRFYVTLFVTEYTGDPLNDGFSIADYGAFDNYLHSGSVGDPGSGDDVGTSGPDSLVGDDQGNSLFGYGGSDELIGRRGNDLLSGGGGHDWLFGDAGKDRLFGGQGNDRLIGGKGADYLSGATGSDVFIYVRPSDSTRLGRDVIDGFDGAGRRGGDRIDLSDIDAMTGRPGLQKLVFGEGHGQGRLWAENLRGDTLVSANLDQDRAAEIQILIVDGPIAASDYGRVDFIL